MSRLKTHARLVPALVAGITLLGLALRLARFEQSLFGDEMSTLYLTQGRSLSDVLSLVSSDAEISPPLYFVLAWLSLKMGSAPELVRAPSLIAGTISIPLVYMLGARLIGRSAGVVAAAVVALSPLMIFYSGDGRSYALMVALLLASTLAMLEAVRGGSARWWGAYALSSCLAMYTHYTAAAVLIGQLAWVLWAHPDARRAAILSNLGAAVLFVPWIPSFLRDNDSPTLEVLSRLQGKSFAAKRYATEVWAVGYPFRTLTQLPGALAAVVGFAGFLGALVAGALRFRSAREPRTSIPGPNVVLVLVLLLSTPVFELALWALTGNDLFGTRNLIAATPGLALLIGLVITAAGRRWGTICTVAVLGCFAVGAARTLDAANHLPDLKGVASYVADERGPETVVLDLYSSALVNPVPTSVVDRYLGEPPTSTPFLPDVSPPFVFPPTREAVDTEVREEVCRAAGGDLVVIYSEDRLTTKPEGQVTFSTSLPTIAGDLAWTDLVRLPGAAVLRNREFEGLDDIRVTTLSVPADACASGGFRG